MITLLERQILDLHDSRSAQLMAEAERTHLRREAAKAGTRVARWRMRLPRWVAVDITLRVSVTAPAGATRRAS